jgi:hypothetical protein
MTAIPLYTEAEVQAIHSQLAKRVLAIFLTRVVVAFTIRRVVKRLEKAAA